MLLELECSLNLKSSRRLVKHATDQARAENEQLERRVWWKYKGKVVREFTSFCSKMGAESALSQLQCIKSSKTSEPILTKCRKGMKFQPLMNKWNLTDINTFGISWKTAWCIIWCSLMRRKLMFSNAKTTRMRELGVEMNLWKAGE